MAKARTAKVRKPAGKKPTSKKRAAGSKRVKTIWYFGPSGADGRSDLRPTLGGKGANLAEMCNIGLPVPAGFTIATHACGACQDAGGRLTDALRTDINKAIRRLEKETGRIFGDPKRPLLVSVRSGAAVSMPGMMDTVLNLGLNADATEGLAESSGNRRFALDARRRFIQMFGNVVSGLPLDAFDRILKAAVMAAGHDHESELEAEHLEGVVKKYLSLYERRTKEPFPEDPAEQLERSIEAVFGSWMGNRAVEYRTIHGISGLVGTAVNVQAMVFGN
ncbi:MAG: pyruvate, phosphate dikinase, partial [bacterium]|nr:pyruvate, phosphate dikinase [bacterium]